MSIEASLEVLRALSDPTRARLLCALDGEELTVAELQEILEVPQPRVSTHLARLKDAGMVLDRVDGPHRYYRRASENDPDSAAADAWSAWRAIEKPLIADPQIDRDRGRRRAVLAARVGEGQSWVDRVAGSLDRHYSPGRTWESLARALTLLCDLGDVADLGAGDGAIAELLATRAKSVVGVDKSERMIAAGRARLGRAGLRHVELLGGDMHATLLPSASFDTVLLQQSLQYAERPADVLTEASRLCRPRGRVLIVTLAAHKHEDVRAAYGHVHLGFRARDLHRWLRAAGLEVEATISAGRERRPPQFEALAVLAHKPPRRMS
jgi:ArsR family transcriptional regulator